MYNRANKSSELIQIYYEDYQKEKCYPFATLYFNKTLTVFFENTCIKDIVSSSKSQKISVCSWNLKDKIKFFGMQKELKEEILESDYEVLSFTQQLKGHQMLKAANIWHPGFKILLEKMLASLGIEIPTEVQVPIYHNHFSALKDIYQDYVKTYLTPCMEVIKNDSEINKLAMADSRYMALDPSKVKNKEYLSQTIGIDYYPMVPFILERLFSIYVHNKKISVTHI